MNLANEYYESHRTNMNVKLYLVALVLGHLFTAGGGEVGEEALLHNYVPDLLK